MRAWIKYTLILVVFMLGVMAGRLLYTNEVQAQSSPCTTCSIEQSSTQLHISLVFSGNTLGYTLKEQTLNQVSPTISGIELFYEKH